MNVWKVKKVFIDYNSPYTQLYVIPMLNSKPKFQLYYQKKYFFGLLKRWVYRCTLSIDPKKLNLEIMESNY